MLLPPLRKTFFKKSQSLLTRLCKQPTDRDGWAKDKERLLLGLTRDDGVDDDDDDDDDGDALKHFFLFWLTTSSQKERLFFFFAQKEEREKKWSLEFMIPPPDFDARQNCFQSWFLFKSWNKPEVGTSLVSEQARGWNKPGVGLTGLGLEQAWGWAHRPGPIEKDGKARLWQAFF